MAGAPKDGAPDPSARAAKASGPGPTPATSRTPPPALSASAPNVSTSHCANSLARCRLLDAPATCTQPSRAALARRSARLAFRGGQGEGRGHWQRRRGAPHAGFVRLAGRALCACVCVWLTPPVPRNRRKKTLSPQPRTRLAGYLRLTHAVSAALRAAGATCAKGQSSPLKQVPELVKNCGRGRGKRVNGAVEAPAGGWRWVGTAPILPRCDAQMLIQLRH